MRGRKKKKDENARGKYRARPRGTPPSPFHARGDSCADTWREFALIFREACSLVGVFHRDADIPRIHNGNSVPFTSTRSNIADDAIPRHAGDDALQTMPPIHGHGLRTFIRDGYTVTNRCIKIAVSHVIEHSTYSDIERCVKQEENSLSNGEFFENTSSSATMSEARKFWRLT